VRENGRFINGEKKSCINSDPEQFNIRQLVVCFRVNHRDFRNLFPVFACCRLSGRKKHPLTKKHSISLFKSCCLWIVLSQLEFKGLRVQSENTGILEISGRAWRFALESGYLPAAGNEVELNGFYENGEFEVSMIEDLTSGQTILLREDTGLP
jgi:hypothetical protein